MEQLKVQGRSVGISIVCAPAGFGKTALLLQYAEDSGSGPRRGAVAVLSANGLAIMELMDALREQERSMPHGTRPLLVVDDIPAYPREETECLVQRVRRMRKEGFEFLVACEPTNRELVRQLGDSYKLSAQALKVQPGEYPEWARALSISNALDVYGLTQGLPRLIVELQPLTSRKDGDEALERAVASVYRKALEAARKARDPIYRLLCLFILTGKGSIGDLERCGMRFDTAVLSRLARDYPLFGYDIETRTYRCMGGGGPMSRLQEEVGRRRPTLAMRACRVLLRANRVDSAVSLAGLLLDVRSSAELIGQFPVQFALTGNAAFVNGIVSRLNGEEAACTGPGLVLAVFLAALTAGEYRLARGMASELRRRAQEIEGEVPAETWTTALELSRLWESCSGIELPKLSESYLQGSRSAKANLLRAHATVQGKLIGGGGDPTAVDYPELLEETDGNKIDLVRLLLECDRLLDDSLHGDVPDPAATDARLRHMADILSERHLAPFVARARMTASVCRLMAGLPIIDERAFTDAGTMAVRESDAVMQLFCLLGEGWQAMMVGQVVNARFRAQQVTRLSEGSHAFLRSWALMLDRAAYVMNTSRITLNEEAELLDLSQETCTPAEAWATALHLGAARLDAELSAWYSMHKAELLDERFRPIARLAMAAVGERADAVRALLPLRLASRYLMPGEAPSRSAPLFSVMSGSELGEIGQVNISLFGGFRAERNGHVITGDIWKRKRVSVLTARLLLSLGSYVSRRAITEEIWPNATYARARDNLYVTLSGMRAAFGQQQNGPQYVLTQGDGIAINGEFVAADTERFDMLARDILLKRIGVSGRQIIDSCLRLEELYAGPLYLPEVGDPAFFARMRRAYLSKFVDCMLRGVDAAVEMEDLPSASWLVEAALRQAPLREDVIRHAMNVYDLSGRRREVVELYHGHLHYLQQQLHAFPEEETRQAYERIVETSKLPVLL